MKRGYFLTLMLVFLIIGIGLSLTDNKKELNTKDYKPLIKIEEVDIFVGEKIVCSSDFQELKKCKMLIALRSKSNIQDKILYVEINSNNKSYLISGDKLYKWYGEEYIDKRGNSYPCIVSKNGNIVQKDNQIQYYFILEDDWPSNTSIRGVESNVTTYVHLSSGAILKTDKIEIFK
ncbi:hypothetical protein DRP05_09025 [Archaeoglobales archaeon]|nr:MAG: hypothetical protein DRP05_09025 [Archaeoglobales archaeon]